MKSQRFGLTNGRAHRLAIPLKVFWKETRQLGSLFTSARRCVCLRGQCEITSYKSFQVVMRIEVGKFTPMKGAHFEKVFSAGGLKVTGFAGRHCFLLLIIWLLPR